jgi:hypothetical protein
VADLQTFNFTKDSIKDMKKVPAKSPGIDVFYNEYFQHPNNRKSYLLEVELYHLQDTKGIDWYKVIDFKIKC